MNKRDKMRRRNWYVKIAFYTVPTIRRNFYNMSPLVFNKYYQTLSYGGDRRFMVVQVKADYFCYTNDYKNLFKLI